MKIKIPMIIDGDNNLKLKTHEGIHFINIDDILYFRAEGAYSNIFIYDEQVVVVCKQLCEMEKYVRYYDFLRIHKSFLVNIKKVTSFESRAKMVNIQGNKLPVSRRKAPWVYQKLLEYGIRDGLILTVYKIF